MANQIEIKAVDGKICGGNKPHRVEYYDPKGLKKFEYCHTYNQAIDFASKLLTNKQQGGF